MSNEERDSTVSGNQGQTWRQVQQISPFSRPVALFDRPMEITVGMLRGLRMVDETVVVYGTPTSPRKGD